MHIASLEAHTTLNTYNLWKLALRGHLNTDARKRSQLKCYWRKGCEPTCHAISRPRSNTYTGVKR